MNATMDSKTGAAVEPTDRGLGQDNGQQGFGQHDLDEGAGAFEGYRELCGLAVGALALALISPLALVHPAFWAIPIITVVLARSALRRIRDVPQQTGRALALLAIAIALISAAAAPIQPYLYDIAMRAQAVEMAREWFVALRNDDPGLAYELTAPKWVRTGAGTGGSAGYYHSRMAPPGTRKPFLEEPAVKLLLSLGNRGHIRFHKHLSVVTDTLAETDRVEDVYVVTSGSGETAEPCFIKLTLTRRLDLMKRVRSWEVTKAEVVDDPLQDGTAPSTARQSTGLVNDAGDRIARS